MNKILVNRLLAATAALALASPGIALAQTNPQPVQGAEVASLDRWSYDELYDQGWSVREFTDEVEVHGAEGEEIGDVENVLFDADGKVVSIIVEVGGFWDIGDTHVNVPWSEVEVRAGDEAVTIPVTEDTVDDFSIFPEQLTAQRAASGVTAVDDDFNAPRIWKGSELIGDYVRLSDGEGYGYVRDIIVGQDGTIAAVVVTAAAPGYDQRGYYAYPYFGYGYGYRPGLSYYGMPYTRGDIERIDRFDYERMKNRFDD